MAHIIEHPVYQELDQLLISLYGSGRLYKIRQDLKAIIENPSIESYQEVRDYFNRQPQPSLGRNLRKQEVLAKFDELIALIDKLIAANDDVYNAVAASSIAFGNVLDNDTIDGNAATTSNVTVTEISNTEPTQVVLNADGTLDSTASAVTGTVTIVYELADINDSNNKQQATVTVNIA